MHWVVFKVLDRDNEPSTFQIMLTNSKEKTLFTLFTMITNEKEAHPCKDIVSISVLNAITFYVFGVSKRKN